MPVLLSMLTFVTEDERMRYRTLQEGSSRGLFVHKLQLVHVMCTISCTLDCSRGRIQLIELNLHRLLFHGFCRPNLHNTETPQQFLQHHHSSQSNKAN